jgi:hypothetical protein
MKKLALIILMCLTGCSPSIKDQFQECFALERNHGYVETVNRKLKQLVPVGSQADRYDDLFSTADETMTNSDETIHTFDNGSGARHEQGLVITITVDNKTRKIRRVLAGVAAM